MTERSLYAHATTLLLTACLLLAGRADAQTPVCGTCLGVTIEPGQVVLLPEALGGFTVLLRVQEAPNDALDAAIEEIRRRGGRPALLVPAPAPDDPAQVYRSKLRLSELRGALGAEVIIALDVSRGSAAGGQSIAALAGYVDVVVGEGPAPPGLPLWKLLPGLEVKVAL